MSSVLGEGLLLLPSTSSREREGPGVVEHRLSCLRACGIFPDQRWNPVSPALAGRFLSTVPLGKPQALFWILEIGSEQNRKTHVLIGTYL